MNEKYKAQDNPVLKTFGFSNLPSFSGVYLIQNLKTGFVYIGQSKNIIQRLRAHRSMLSRNTHFCKQLQTDFNLYGLENFQVTLVHESERDEAKNERLKIETEWIQKIEKDILYNKPNREKENNGFFGKKHTENFKQLLSSQRASVMKNELGVAIQIPPFVSRKGNQSPGGRFISIAEASRRTNISRRDIRKRLTDPNFPEWRILDQKELEEFKKQRKNEKNA